MQMQVGQRGTTTLPAEMRREYNVQPGDTFTVIALGADRFLMVRGVSEVDAAADRLRERMVQKGATLEDMLAQLRSAREGA